MKFRSILMVCALAVGLAGCEKNLGPIQSTTRSGQLTVVSLIEVLPVERDAISEPAKEYLRTLGWTETIRGFEYHEDLTEFSLKLGDEILPINPDGHFELAAMGQPSLQYQGYEIRSNIAPLEQRSVDGRLEYTMTLSVGEHLAQHDHLGHDQGAPGLSPQGCAVPCLDYNGPWGNQNPGATGGQKYTNFIASDCQMAWPVCTVRDFTWWPYCNCSRNCSSLIGHCGRYHRHTYPGGPSC